MPSPSPRILAARTRLDQARLRVRELQNRWERHRSPRTWFQLQQAICDKRMAGAMLDRTLSPSQKGRYALD
jgi:hypothetical protein